MTITLQPDLESRLKETARRLRLSPDDYAASLIASGLDQPHRATIDLLHQWQAADATDDPAEVARRQKEAEDFMQSLSQSRREMEGSLSRKIGP